MKQYLQSSLGSQVLEEICDLIIGTAAVLVAVDLEDEEMGLDDVDSYVGALSLGGEGVEAFVESESVEREGREGEDGEREGVEGGD